MNARSTFSDFMLDIILKKISQALIDEQNEKKIEISFTCYPDDSDSINGFKDELNFLKNNKIISNLKHDGGVGYVEDENGRDQEMYVCTSVFSLDFEKLRKFQIETSRSPKYWLKMNSDRRLILNDKYILTKPHFNSPNYYFISYALENPGEIITKESLEKKAGRGQVNKRFHTILEQLNITPLLKMLFFPDVAGDATKFRNNLTLKELENLNINVKEVDDFIEKLKNV